MLFEHTQKDKLCGMYILHNFINWSGTLSSKLTA